MARKARSNEIDLTRCRVYHVVSRCVRALHLLGSDDEARKELCMRCLEMLAQATAVEVAGFSLMNNHLHLLLRVDVERADGWSNQEVVGRWLMLHPQRNGYFQPIDSDATFVEKIAADSQWVETTRQKLCSISQFMKELKQRIAQAANRADHVTGAFWEGRYKVKAVRDEAQMLATLAYIDLNPFAADLCKKPEDGSYTSLQGRLGRDEPVAATESRPLYASRGKRHNAQQETGTNHAAQGSPASPASAPPPHRVTPSSRQPSSTWLVPFDERRKSRRLKQRHRRNAPDTCPIPPHRDVTKPVLLPGLSLRVYLNLVDATARLLRGGKKRLGRDTEPILKRLAITPAGLGQRVQTLVDHWARQLQILGAAI